jgi:hypothetical protein
MAQSSYVLYEVLRSVDWGGCGLFDNITEETDLAIIWRSSFQIYWDFGYPERFIVFLSSFRQMTG